MSFKIQRGLFKLDIADHYAILGLPVNADTKQVRKRYVRIAHILHPDTCKGFNKEQKQLANKLLSTLVNPAKEALYKEKSRAEYQLVLSKIGEQLKKEASKISISSQPAKNLLQAGNSIDIVYGKELKALAVKQYESLEEVLSKIAQISELNLVYLTLKGGTTKQNVVRSQKTKTDSSSTDAQKSTQINPEEQRKLSLIDNYMRRAQSHLKNQDYTSAVKELKTITKIDSNHASAYSLMGIAYLKQKQLSMAKVYLNKAIELNPQDEAAKQAKRELNNLLEPDKKGTKPRATGTDGKQGKGSLFSGLFGGKKR